MGKPLRVLIVEDSEDDAELLVRELRRGGYEPAHERVESAPSMTAALTRGGWEVVLSDYSLPRFSGLAALDLLRARGLDLPFLVISGTVDEETAVAAMKAGAHDYIFKGNLARLVPAIERELREAGERAARRDAESALQASERRFQCLIENMSGIIAVLNLEGGIVYASPSVESILGAPAEGLIGTNLCEHAHPEDLPFLTTFLEALRCHPGVLLPVEFRFQHPDGSWRLLGATARNLIETPGIQGVVLNARDITERKQLEDQLRQAQKMEAVGRLAGGVAHDFNNMLGAITGYSDLLLHRLGPEAPARDCLLEIMKAAERAANLTRQLLVFSRKEVLAPQVLDLGEVVINVQRMLERLIGEDIELVTASEPGMARVKTDPGQMEQVLLNLAVNARDAMPQGGRLTIETRNVALDELAASRHAGVAPGAYVLLAVTDTGCGMDAENQSHIFEPFFTTKEAGRGTGLGLATVYGIVQQSRGHIRVDSQPGQGTSFRIYLPQSESVPEPRLTSPAAAPPLTGTETILLVEDEEILRRLLIQVLESSGYTVLPAAEAGEALRRCQEQAVDLLLTDVVMPGMSGRELAEQAVALHPQMKVLFMSGHTDDAVLRHGVLVADIAFLQKPFKPAELARKVREVLEGSALSAA